MTIFRFREIRRQRGKSEDKRIHQIGSVIAIFFMSFFYIFVVLDFCFINNACYIDGQTQVRKDCLVCQPNTSKTNWTLKNG